MNLDHLNILSLLSSDQALGELQQTIQEASSLPGEFADLLIEKIGQVNNVSDSNLVDDFKINSPENANKLQELAGLFIGKDTTTGFSSLTGRGLPTAKKLEIDIDLENTLDALANVMNTLQGTKFNEGDIKAKLTSLVEKIEAIKPAIPLSVEFEEKFNKIVDTFQKINREIFDSTPEQDVAAWVKDTIPGTIPGAIPVKEPENEDQSISEPVVEADPIEIQTSDLHAIDVQTSELQVALTQEPELERENTKIVETSNHFKSNDTDFNISDLKDVAALVVQKDIGLETTKKDVGNLDVSTQESPENKQEIAENITRLKPETIQEKEVQLVDRDFPVPVNLVDHIDRVVDVVKQIEDIVSKDTKIIADIENQVDLLGKEIEIIKDIVYQQTSKSFTISANSLNSQVEQPQKVIELTQAIESDEPEDEALLDDQLAAIVATLAEPIRHEKAVTGSRVVEQLAQQVKSEIKPETLSLKQIAEEQSLGIITKDQSDDLLQSDGEHRKAGQDNPVINPFQNGKTKGVEAKGFNFGDDKDALKFVTEFSLLNKSHTFENKTEIPPMTKHFAHPEWNKEIGERVVWMHKQAIPSAELRLNPKHLGPITIKVDVNQDQVSVAFTAQHAAVKEAIDAAMPKLREMFSAQQLNLAEVNVSQENLDQRQSRGFAQMGNEQGKGGRENKDAENNGQNDHTKTAMEIVDEIEAGRAIASNGVLSIFA